MSIKRITINYEASNWGIPTNLYSSYVTFTSNQIKYVRRPYMSCKNNPRIEYSYNPLPNGFLTDIEKDDYESDFKTLCSIVESLIKFKHKMNVLGLDDDSKQIVCDANPASIDITYDDKKKINIPLFAIPMDFEINTMYKIADKYAPSIFKQEYEEDED